MNLSLLLVVVLGGLLIFMMYNSRKKQRKQAEEMSTKLGPGAKVMTTFGVFGTVISIDEEENQVLLESGPGTQLKVHRQAVGKILEGAPSLDSGVPAIGSDAAADDLGDVSVPDDASSLTDGFDRPAPEYGKYADDDDDLDTQLADAQAKADAEATHVEAAGSDAADVDADVTEAADAAESTEADDADAVDAADDADVDVDDTESETADDATDSSEKK